MSSTLYTKILKELKELNHVPQLYCPSQILVDYVDLKFDRFLIRDNIWQDGIEFATPTDSRDKIPMPYHSYLLIPWMIKHLRFLVQVREIFIKILWLGYPAFGNKGVFFNIVGRLTGVNVWRLKYSLILKRVTVILDQEACLYTGSKRVNLLDGTVGTYFHTNARVRAATYPPLEVISDHTIQLWLNREDFHDDVDDNIVPSGVVIDAGDNLPVQLVQMTVPPADSTFPHQYEDEDDFACGVALEQHEAQACMSRSKSHSKIGRVESSSSIHYKRLGEADLEVRLSDHSDNGYEAGFAWDY